MENRQYSDRWLPTTAKEVKARGWEQVDVILFSGDAYVDHPSFGVAVIGRLLEAEGYRVAIVPQPNWQDDLRDFKKLGKPRLFFGVTAGNMDSMVNHYTANIRLRSDDAYTPGGKSGFRPDYAATVYTKILKNLFPDTPVVLGGIEASLRRLTHYDYWSNTLKPSILADSGADIVAYGMGDKVMIDIAKALHNGFNMNLLRKINQVAYVADEKAVKNLPNPIILHSFEKCVADNDALGENFVKIETESNKLNSEILVEPFGDKYVVVNPPYPLISEKDLDRSYELPYMRRPHPKYDNKGDIPAFEMIKFSVNIHRGCFGGCSFCTISAHQGKFIVSRSEESIVREVEAIVKQPDFRGNLSDLGGPSANMYKMHGKNIDMCAKCVRASCIYPNICKNLDNDHGRILSLYKKVRNIKGIKKAYIGSGIRYDMFIEGNDQGYLEEVVKNHVSGRLKVAPEHTNINVLKQMRKPSFDLFFKLNDKFSQICVRNNLKYQLIPYFISSHPGCTERDMKDLSTVTRRLNMRLEQVQDFTPTPMTLSSVMFRTGKNPYTGEPLYVARNQNDKKNQKKYFFSPKK